MKSKDAWLIIIISFQLQPSEFGVSPIASIVSLQIRQSINFKFCERRKCVGDLLIWLVIYSLPFRMIIDVFLSSNLSIWLSIFVYKPIPSTISFFFSLNHHFYSLEIHSHIVI